MDVGADASPQDADVMPEDVTASDGATDASPSADAEWVELTLTDGSRLTGELVATYDTTLWWDPGQGDTYAIFNPANHAAYPNDRSFRFVDQSDVASLEPWQPDDDRSTYRQFLRERNILFERPPLEEVSWVITGNDSYHLEENGFGDFAWDFELTDDEGNRFTGTGTQNSDH